MAEKIVLNVGMDRKDFLNGAKDIQYAMKSLLSMVNSTGREIRTAANGYGTAMMQSVKASRDFESNIQKIKTQVQELRTSTTSIKAAADSFTTLKERIAASEQEWERLRQQQKFLESAGANKPSEAWEKNQEAIRQANEQLDAYEKRFDALIEMRDRYNRLASTGVDDDGRQLTNNERESYGFNAGVMDEAAKQISEKHDELLTQLEALEQAQAEFIANGENLPTPEWTELQEAIANARSSVNEMKSILENMREAGYENADQSDEYKEQAQKIKELERAIDEAEQKKDELLKSPVTTAWNSMTSLTKMLTEGFGRVKFAADMALMAIQHPVQTADRALGALISTIGRTVSAFAHMAGNAALSFLKNLAVSAKNAAIQLAKMISNAVISGLNRLAIGARNAAVSLAKLAGNAVQTGLAAIGKLAMQAGKSMLGLNKSVKKSRSGFAASFKTILKYAFGIRSLYFLFRRLRQAFTDGVKEIAKKNPELKASLNSLSKSLSALKGSIASAFAPLVTVVAPILTMLMDMLTSAMNTVGAFFAALTGKNTYQKSIGKIGTSAKQSSKNVKELNRQLAGFDHLNILSDKSTNKNEKDSGLAYETVAVPDSIKDFVAQIKKLWNAEDFEGLGMLFADKINGVFKWLNSAIDWENVGGKIEKAITAITGTLNGLVAGIDWELIGNTVGKGINTIVNSFDLLLSGVNWYNIGKSIARGLNSLLKTVNWEKLGKAFAKKINAFIQVAYGIISKFDWGEAGKAFKEVVEGLVDTIDWDLMGQSLLELLSGVLEFLYTAITGIDWEKIITEFQTGFDAFIKGLKRIFKGFKPKAAELGTTLGKIIVGLFDVNWTDIGETLAAGFNLAITFIESAIEEFKKNAPTIGSNLASGIDAFINEVDWPAIGELLNTSFTSAIDFVNAMLDKFTKEGTAETLGTKIAEMLGKIQWGTIATGVWTAIKKAFSLAGNFVDALFSEPLDLTRAEIDPAYVEKVVGFNDKGLGERMGIKIKSALSGIPWRDIGTTLWETAKQAFSTAGSFIATLVGAEGATEENWPQKLGDRIGELLAGIPWQRIFEGMIDTVMNFLNPALQKLLGSKDGRVLVAISGALLALRVGIGKLIVAALGGIAGTISAGAATIALAVADVVGVVKAVNLAGDINDSADELKRVVNSQLETLKGFYERGETDLAAVYAKAAFGVDINGKTYSEALQTSIDGIREMYKDAPKDWFDALFGTSQTVADDLEAEANRSMTSYFNGFVNAIFENSQVTEECKQAITAIFDVGGFEAHGGNAATTFYDGFRSVVIENGEVKEEYKDAVEAIFGTVDSDELGSMTIEQFYTAFKVGAIDENGNITDTFKGLMESIFESTDSNGHGTQVVQSYYEGFTTELQKTGELKKDYVDAIESIFSAGDTGEQGKTGAEKFYDGFMGIIMDNGEVKGKYKEAVESIFGTVDSDELGSMSIKDFYAAFKTGAIDGEGHLTKDFIAIMDGVYTSVNSESYGKEYTADLFNAFRDSIMENGHIKEEYKQAWEAIFGSVDSLENGSMTAEQFYAGWNKGVNSENATAQGTLVTAFSNVVKALNDSLGIQSPSTVAAGIAKYFLEGFAKGAEDNQESAQKRVTKVFETISNAISSVVSGVKGFFSKLLGGGKKKDDDQGTVSADDIAKPYEDGSKRAKTALDGLKKNVTNALSAMKKDVSELQKIIEDAMTSISDKEKAATDSIKKDSTDKISEIKNKVSEKLSEIQKALTAAFDSIIAQITTKFESIKTIVDNKVVDIKNKLSENLSAIQAIVKENLQSIKTEFDTSFKDIKKQVVTDMAGIKGELATFKETKNNINKYVGDMKNTFVSNASTIQNKANNLFKALLSAITNFGNACDTSSYKFSGMISNVIDGASSYIEAVGGINSASDSIVDAINNAYTNAKGVSFYGVGVGIINGVISGINDGWTALSKAARRAAQAALKAAKSELGIHSPSKVFRDEIGVNMIAGLIEGWESMEPEMLKTISGVSDVASNEIDGNKISTDLSVTDGQLINGLDDVLNNFSDKVAGSFQTLVNRLSSISEAVTFRTPNVAAGTVTPYIIAANVSGPTNAHTGANESNQDELISVLIQLVNNQTTAIVRAIQQNNGQNKGFDVIKSTSDIINEINRRTKADGKSPLLI